MNLYTHTVTCLVCGEMRAMLPNALSSIHPSRVNWTPPQQISGTLSSKMLGKWNPVSLRPAICWEKWNPVPSGQQTNVHQVSIPIHHQNSGHMLIVEGLPTCVLPLRRLLGYGCRCQVSGRVVIVTAVCVRSLQ